MTGPAKYDEPEFFGKYADMPRSRVGLAAAGEWPALRSLLPDLRGRRVLDLGCGFGWHCRYAAEQGAAFVLGLDVSERMLAEARRTTVSPVVEYRRQAIEALDLAPASFDVVLSSLALHYVDDLAGAARRIRHALAPAGTFVMSVEHPVFTALAAQDWHRDTAGRALHWPLDDYRSEGIRRTRWLAGETVKHHRTIETWLNGLIDAGFAIVRVLEPEPPEDMVAARPDLADERRRPMFLLVAARAVEGPTAPPP